MGDGGGEGEQGASWCPVCGDSLHQATLVSHDMVERRPLSYVVPSHVRQRVLFVTRSGEVGEKDLVYHLTFVWVPRPDVRGRRNLSPPREGQEDTKGVRGHWVRTLCGPIVYEPVMAWVR